MRCGEARTRAYPTFTYRFNNSIGGSVVAGAENRRLSGRTGVSDVYASPYFHGASLRACYGYYMLIITAERGHRSRADYDAWVAVNCSARHGPWFWICSEPCRHRQRLVTVVDDVLENGHRSHYVPPNFGYRLAALKTDLRNKVSATECSVPYGTRARRGGITVRFLRKNVLRALRRRRLPIALALIATSEAALEILAEYKDYDFYAELQAFLTRT